MINIDQKHVTKVSYSEYKCEVKKQIQKKVKEEIKEAKQKMTKLRLINPDNEQKYVKETTINEFTTIMKIRLNMINAKCNYIRKEEDRICRICKEDETTEHLLGCQTNHEIEFDVNKVEDLDWLRKIIKPYELFENMNS